MELLDHIIPFWRHKDMEGLPEWEISSKPGLPPRQHKLERRYTPFRHTFILTRRIWEDDYDGQMIFGDLMGLKLPDICLTGDETRKNLTQETCPERESNPGLLRDRRAWYCLFHSAGCKSYFVFNNSRWAVEPLVPPLWSPKFESLTHQGDKCGEQCRECLGFFWESPISLISSHQHSSLFHILIHSFHVVIHFIHG